MSARLIPRGSRVGRGLVPRGVVLAALLGGIGARAQIADPPTAAVIGEVCADLDDDGACTAADLPLPGFIVRTATGLGARTDADGRFHIAAVGGEHSAFLADGTALPRPTTLALFVDASPLGPTARVPDAIQVALPPAGVAHAVFAIGLPTRTDDPPAHAPPDAFVRPRLDGTTLVLDVPLEVGAGHTLTGPRGPIAETSKTSAPAAPAVDSGVTRALLSLALAGREASAIVVDRARDGRARIVRIAVVRAPREEGGDLLIVKPPETLATFDLPPAYAASAPGRVLVPVHAPPGTIVDVNGTRARIGPTGRGFVWTQLTGESVKVRIADPSGAADSVVDLPVTTSALAALDVNVAGEARVGGVGLAPFAQGHVEADVHLPIDNGVIAAGVSVDDDVTRAALNGTLLLQPAHAGLLARIPDPDVDMGVYGDASTSVQENPAQLALWARATSSLGEAGIGVTQTPLDDGEVGRLERTALGPYVDGAVNLGPVRVGVEAAADASSVPFVTTTALVPAHVEIESTGGRVYWLAHGAVAPGSEHVVIASVDPTTGLVLDRNVLVRGADYDVDYASGRVVLAAPLGLAGFAAGATFGGAGSIGSQTRVIVDYAHAATAGEAATHDSAARIHLGSADGRVDGGASGALSNDASLLGMDVTASPAPWAQVSASVARADGSWTHPNVDGTARVGGTAFDNGRARGPIAATSLDGGLSYNMPLEHGGGGDAAALRARLGGDSSYVAAWGAWRDAGFTDGSGGSALDAGRAGAEGRVDIFDTVQLSAIGDGRTGQDPSTLDENARLTTLDTNARAQVTLGPVRVAADAVRRQADRGTPLPESTIEVGPFVQSGSAVGVGGEVGVALTPRVEVSVAHLQGVYVVGNGPGARDPTFSSLGARVALGDGSAVEARIGVHPDLRPEGRVNVVVDDAPTRSLGDNAPASNVSHYGGFAVTSDDPWTGRSTTSVTGARQQLGPRTDVFAEQRTSSTDRGVLAGRAAGGESALGPFVLGLSWENSERVVDGPAALRDAITARLGIDAALASAHSFAEIARVTPRDGVAAGEWALGGAGRLSASDEVSFGTRAIVGEGRGLDGGPARPFSEVLVGTAFRPRARHWAVPSALAQYSLRGDRRLADGLLQRLHLLRAGVTFGALPGFSLGVAGQLAQDEALDDSNSDTVANLVVTQAALASVRAEVPVWLLVPAVELGGRGVFGAGVGPELAGTARAELAIRLGPAAVGLGVVVLGYTGTGLEPLTLEPSPPPVYLVLRGAL